MVRRKLPTQADVAKLAGVSVPVVSAVINEGSGTVRVGEESADRVRRAIEALSYVPNPIARSLIGGRSGIIAVFTFDPIFPSVRDNFFYPFLQGIEAAVEGKGFDLLLLTADAPAPVARSLYVGGRNRCALADGAIILGSEPNRDELRRLAEDEFPFVIVGRREVEGITIPHVAATYADATAALVERAIGLGHKQLRFIGLPDAQEPAIDRRAGFAKAIASGGQGIEGSLVEIGLEVGAAETSVAAAYKEGVTVLFAETGHLAEALDRAAASLGIDVPGAVSICALSNAATDYAHMRDFTRVSIPRFEMGGAALRMLLRRLSASGDVAPHVTRLKCALVDGTTLAEATCAAQSRNPQAGG